jgi:hypothetical protein
MGRAKKSREVVASLGRQQFGRVSEERIVQVVSEGASYFRAGAPIQRSTHRATIR